MEIRNQNHGEPLMVWALKTASGSVSSHLPLSPRPVQTAGGRLPRTRLCPRGHRLLSLLTLAPIWEPPHGDSSGSNRWSPRQRPLSPSRVGLILRLAKSPLQKLIIGLL